MEMEGMEGAILIFMLGNMEQTVTRKQTKREKNNAQKRTEGWKQKGRVGSLLPEGMEGNHGCIVLLSLHWHMYSI